MNATREFLHLFALYGGISAFAACFAWPLGIWIAQVVRGGTTCHEDKYPIGSED